MSTPVPPGPLRSLLKPSESIFQDYGIVEVGYTEKAQPSSYEHFQSWVKEKGPGPLTYMTGDRANKRSSLKNLYPEFQSALVFLFKYPKTDMESWPFKLASYLFAFGGEDYHYKVREALEQIGANLQTQIPGLEFKTCVDIEPVLERDLAYRSGLGWFGKNSMLISRDHGSFTLIGSLLLSQKLPIENANPETDHCGTCTACIEACPTDAIDGDNRRLISEKCISTFTIELFKEHTAPMGYENGEGSVFGCDICQLVCPWNSKTSIERNEYSDNSIFSFFQNKSTKEVFLDLQNMSNRQFRKFFKGTSLERTGRVGFLKNLKPYL